MTDEEIRASNVEIRDLCCQLPLMHQRLFRAGMLKTAHAMTAAVQAAGYEAAEKIEENCDA